MSNKAVRNKLSCFHPLLRCNNSHKGRILLPALYILCTICVTVSILAGFREKVEINETTEITDSCSQNSAESYELAKEQSFGYFDNIPDSDWKRLQKDLRNMELFHNKKNPQRDTNDYAIWYVYNVYPMFSCPHLRRVGGLGDGPKWVCDPHRLANVSDCLIYSVGSMGNYAFEDGINAIVGKHCEIHQFDPDPRYRRDGDPELRNIHFHPWGLKSSYMPMKKARVAANPKRSANWTYNTLQDSMKLLGHEGRRIHVFKIDCEACEWNSFNDWFEVDIGQILVETHAAWIDDGDNVTASYFYDQLLRHGFVPFSKEANTSPWAVPHGTFFEYGFIRLHQSFFIGSQWEH